MRKHEVRIGATYRARYADKDVIVRVTGLSRWGGWNVIDTAPTPHHQFRIKSAIKFISEVKLRAKDLPVMRRHPKLDAILKRMGPRAS